MKLTFHPSERVEGLEPFTIELTDDQYDQVVRHCEEHGLDLEKFFANLIGDFLSTHPIIAQTRRTQ